MASLSRSSLSSLRSTTVSTLSKARLSAARHFSVLSSSNSIFSTASRFRSPLGNKGLLGAAQLKQFQARFLDLHEYQSKALMAKHGVRVQKGQVANTAEEAAEVALRLKREGANDLIVKAQILAGGRGKGHFNTGFKGGVKVCQEPDEVKNMSAKMLGNHLITKQTGAEGQLVSKVLVHEGVDFDRELYFAIIMDRSQGGPTIVASPMGGMDIEEVAVKHPDQIHVQPVDIMKGIQPSDTARIATLLGFNPGSPTFQDAQEQMANLYNMFIANDCTQVEINPLVLTKTGKVYCVDAKLGFDDNAQFRQQALFAMRDTSMEDPREVEASKYGLNYIGLDGNIGCMVNGAGLAMATMDIIKLHGGQPANFLDVGGGATEKQVEEAFKILTADPKVKALLVNIFGGIMKCDVIAKGVVNAAVSVKLQVPLVVRLAGTNVDKGKEILKKSGLNIIPADDLDDAAKKAVASLA
eukprot:TRINITY_DN6581_c0_g1_i1.p1 TRINITY_DN6581_c0_g1~~TRINITY_DN6581_c0_g1_i1.p1  ORF type:complete len:499 (-),score=221.91 TRINITY_DN6581_c0_g1_i1:262-1665(-)